MKNDRGAGRKSKITPEQLDEILKKIAEGESVSSLAEQFGISKQGLYRKIHSIDQVDILNLDYIVDDKIITKLFVDLKNETLKIVNINSRLSERPFGNLHNPLWDDFIILLEKEYFLSLGADLKCENFILCEESDFYIRLEDIFSSTNCHLRIASESAEITGNYFSLIRPYNSYKSSDTYPDKSLDSNHLKDDFVLKLNRTSSDNLISYNSPDLENFMIENSMIENSMIEKSMIAQYQSGPLNKLAIKQYIKRRNLPMVSYKNKDKILRRAYLKGYQIKALTDDRLWLIKAQAIKDGTILDDWAVELIAMDICRQLDIPYLKQSECNIVIDGKLYKGLKSENFAADGYEFVSLIRLLNNIGYSLEGFEHFDTINKLKWCADKLSLSGSIEYKKALKYMIDLALVDSLVGNTDRSLDNIGLIYDINSGKYQIAPVFNCGQGLFEHDEYRDTYLSYSSAILTVTIAPYDETPFDMLKLLNEEFGLTKLYPALKSISYNSSWMKPYVVEYINKMKSYCTDNL